MILLPLFAESTCTPAFLDAIQEYNNNGVHPDYESMFYCLSDFCMEHKELRCDACGNCESCLPNGCFNNHNFL